MDEMGDDVSPPTFSSMFVRTGCPSRLSWGKSTVAGEAEDHSAVSERGDTRTRLADTSSRLVSRHCKPGDEIHEVGSLPDESSHVDESPESTLGSVSCLGRTND